MNKEKSLKNRIRGWFPKEPYMIGRTVKVDIENKQQPPLVQPEFKVSATVTAGAIAVFWILIIVFQLDFEFLWKDGTLIYQFGWLIVGFTAGAVFGGLATRTQLNRISKNYNICGHSKKEMLLVLVPMLVLFVPSAIYLFTGFSTDGQRLALLQSASSIFSYAISFYIIRFLDFYVFERREGLRLMQGWLGLGIIVIPKPPNSRNVSGKMSKTSDWLGGILFVNTLAVIAVTSVLYWFAVINVTGFAIISIIAGSFFVLLYALDEKLKTDFLSKIGMDKRKIVSIIFVVIGIILLVFSLALVSHVEQRLTEVPHRENLLSKDFDLDRQIPNATVSVNLTTQDAIAYGIFPASYINSRLKGYSSIDFSINYKPASGGPLIKVYERNNISSRTLDGGGYWSVTQNGTYILTLHYNYNETIHVNENIGRVWSTSELLPTVVYTPLLASYMAPTLIIASVLLTGSAVIPIQQIAKASYLKHKQGSGFAFSGLKI